MYFFYFFNPIAFKVSWWIPKIIWSVQVNYHLFWGTHPSMIPWHSMSMYVAARHLIFCGAGSVFYLPATSAMIVQAMHTCIVVNVDFFPLDTLQQNISMFYPTPTKTHTSKITLPRFQMWTCMFLAASHLIQSSARVNCQTYWRLTKQYTFFENNP